MWFPWNKSHNLPTCKAASELCMVYKTTLIAFTRDFSQVCRWGFLYLLFYSSVSWNQCPRWKRQEMNILMSCCLWYTWSFIPTRTSTKYRVGEYNRSTFILLLMGDINSINSPCSRMCGFIVQLVEHRNSMLEATGLNPIDAQIFFRLLLSNWSFFTFI